MNSIRQFLQIKQVLLVYRSLRSVISGSLKAKLSEHYIDFAVAGTGTGRLFPVGCTILDTAVGSRMADNFSYRAMGENPYEQVAFRGLLLETTSQFKYKKADKHKPIDFIPAAHIAFVELAVELLLRGETTIDVNKDDYELRITEVEERIDPKNSIILPRWEVEVGSQPME